ncbi:DUF3037 domain-containing protein [Salegentibacter sp. BLCTC]|uniref:DUF3037 domain-containing protein n=1 Tax=Salegentibacter maritimus TaxID=2794347 RepID=A0ABS0TFI9_9FLAO|nr:MULTISPECIES: DUF3037 domain-containing protein [Salegentibacter]MBE7639167.1 DUF3037 domain-containing protein [Salegentibacter sp. BLCTC]MBI6119820.1 DUF3037 domain-containing protein [Salegentibacter maritimus]
MQEKHLYEYAVIRLVPKVEREEFLNVGIILFSKKEKFLKAVFNLDEERLRIFSKDMDRDEICSNLDSFKKICEGNKNGGPIAQLDLPSRFRWLTAVRSSIIQTSRPHPGMTNDLDVTLKRLFKELVL